MLGIPTLCVESKTGHVWLLEGLDAKVACAETGCPLPGTQNTPHNNQSTYHEASWVITGSQKEINTKSSEMNAALR